MTIDIEAIRKLASEATPGPWKQWAGKGWPEAATVIMPAEMCIGVWWPLRAPDETQDDKPLAWFLDPRDQAFASLAIEALPQLCDEVELLRTQLADALEEVRRLTPSPAAPHGYYLATIGSGGGVEGASEPAYTVFLSDRNIVLHGEEAQQFLEAQRASFPKPEPVEVLDAPKGDENGL